MPHCGMTTYASGKIQLISRKIQFFVRKNGPRISLAVPFGNFAAKIFVPCLPPDIMVRALPGQK
jgi:hypothetical protein